MEEAAFKNPDLSALPDANGEDPALRPDALTEFIGQQSLRENLRIFVDAARARGEAMDHTLFYGPPGLGKTTLAQIVARELGVGFRGNKASKNTAVTSRSPAAELPDEPPTWPASDCGSYKSAYFSLRYSAPTETNASTVRSLMDVATKPPTRFQPGTQACQRVFQPAPQQLR